MNLPEVITPKALAEHMGWPERRVRRIARALGACLISGDCMTLTEADVLKIMESQRCRSNSTSGAIPTAGANTAIGHRCSNLIEQIDAYRTAEGDQRAHLVKSIQRAITDFDAFQ